MAKLFQVSPEALTVDDLCPLLSWKEQYSSAPGSAGLYWIYIGHFTYGWSLMVLKSSLMGSATEFSYPPS